MKRTFLSLLIACLFISCFSIQINASDINFSDIKGHWAEKAIFRWAGEGVVQGANGKFRPNDTVTRAELTTILNRILRYPAAKENPFSDVKKDDWFYQAAVNFREQKMLRTNDATFAGNTVLERQEAVFLIAKAFGIRTAGPFPPFKDFNEVEMWAEGQVRTMYYRGYINGNPDNTFAPAASVTRAEIVTILNNMVDLHIDKPGVYNNLGGKRVLVTSPDVTIQNSSPIHLFISPAVGQGKVSIDEVTGSVNEEKPSYFCIVGISANVLASSAETPKLNFTPLAGVTPEEEITTVDSRFASGDGTQQNPYRIANEMQLSIMREYGDKTKHSSIYFVLNNDISLKEPWSPFVFVGQLDGRGYTIKNMKINFTEQREVYLGLFTRIERDATIRNLSVQGEITAIDGYSSKTIGGISGNSGGTITNCHTNVNISSGAHSALIGGIAGNQWAGKIENCTASGSINAVSKRIAKDPDRRTSPTLLSDSLSSSDICIMGVGGIAGKVYDNTVVNACKSSSAIHVSTGEISGYVRVEIGVGGICGYLIGKVENSSVSKPASINLSASGFTDETRSEGSAGGIVGRLDLAGKIRSCSSNINVSISGTSHPNAGGLVGKIFATDLSEPTVTRSYATGQTKVESGQMQNDAGGLIGHMEGGLVTECWSGGSAVTSGTPVWINATGGFIGACYESSENREKNIIRNCYSITSVSSSGGTSVMGGFVGRAFGTFENCYAVGAVKADSFVGGTGIAVGDTTFRECGDFLNNSRGYPLFASLNNGNEKTTKVTYGDLAKTTTYTSRSWDFNSVWTMPSSGSYKLPILRNLDQKTQTANPQPSHIK